MSLFRGKPRGIPPEEVMRALQVRPGVTHWRTKDGQDLRPEDMEPRHRLNTLNFVVRQVSEYYAQQSLAELAADIVAGGNEDSGTEDAADEYLEKSQDAELCWATATRRWPVLHKIRALVAADAVVWVPAHALRK